MGSTIEIRSAKPSDLSELLRFEQEIIKTERPFDSTLKEGLISYYDISKMISQKDIIVLVALADKKLIASGYARIEKAKPYLKHKNYAYLGFMYVVEEFRGKGVNKLLIEKLNEWILKQNIHEVRLDVYTDNKAAIGTYEKAGFKKHLVNMRYEI